ncbi:hypothetical protein AOLI_G00280230 [Acnodon oligacanthus]
MCGHEGESYPKEREQMERGESEESESERERERDSTQGQQVGKKLHLNTSPLCLSTVRHLLPMTATLFPSFSSNL